MKVCSPDLLIDHLSVTYADAEQATLDGLNMRLGAEQWNCILGRSGCGKTTLLKYLAGLLPADCHVTGGLTTDAAALFVDNVAYMAQQDLLFPWLSVLDNVCLASRLRKQHVQTSTEKARQLLTRVGLSDAMNLKPQQLSGGMRQRVALARTLIQDKPVVLMDEPFSALDAVTRYQLQQLSHQLLAGKTVVLITHDPAEACRLADQLFLLERGALYLDPLPLPETPSPRAVDQTSAALQQHIMQRLGAGYE